MDIYSAPIGPTLNGQPLSSALLNPVTGAMGNIQSMMPSISPSFTGGSAASNASGDFGAVHFNTGSPWAYLAFGAVAIVGIVAWVRLKK